MQQRFDEGTPKHHYFFTQVRAVEALHPADDVLLLISSYLARQRDVSALLGALEYIASNHASFYIMYASLCEYGATKYSRGNYRLGQTVCHYLDHAIEHWLHRHEFDAESGLPHSIHCAWNIVQAMEQPESRDDRLPALAQ